MKFFCVNPKLMLLIVVLFVLFSLLVAVYRDTSINDSCTTKFTTQLGSPTYDWQLPVAPPSLQSYRLKIATTLMSNRFIGPILRTFILKKSCWTLLHLLASQIPSQIHPVYYPIVHPSPQSLAYHIELKSKKIPIPQSPRNKAIYPRIQDFSFAYQKKKTDPTSICKQIIAGIHNLEERGLNIFVNLNETDILKQARESQKRIDEGKKLSIFDGVPVALKDEFHLKGYPSLAGGFPGNEFTISLVDDPIVKRLKDAGAIIIGKTIQVEWGSSPLGWNYFYKGPFNPHNESHYTGGSSSGCAAAVASGILPVCIGLDSGGSIRLPASWSGVNGIAPTFTRVPFHGDGVSYSTNRAGPIAASVEDIALIYELIAQPIEGHTYSHLAPFSPPAHYHDIQNFDLSDLKFCIPRVFASDSDPVVKNHLEKLISFFESKE